MFIGRKNELEQLEQRYNSNNFEFVVVYGRRRVGKTRLLSEFCTGKKAVFFVAEEYNDTVNLEKFSDTIFSVFDKPEYLSSFAGWEDAFAYIIDVIKEERIVIVLDEFPYIVNAKKEFLSLLKNLIDHKFIYTNIFLIVCGSSMSFMENEVLAYKSPLFGRRTAQMLIKPFHYYDAAKFFTVYSNQDKIKIYGILGGIPHYLLKFDNKVSVMDNIKKNILSNAAYLYDEPVNLLHQELRNPAVYNSIIEAVASGASRLNEISTKIKEDSKKTAKYIRSLLNLNILYKEAPISKEISRKNIYRLNDNLFSFIYRFVYKNKSLVEQGKCDYIYENKIEPYFNEYLGPIFEKVCMEFLIYANTHNKLPFVADEIGRWWGNNPIKKQQEEIDIIAVGENESAIFCECKYRNQQVQKNVLDTLVERSNLLGYKNKYFYIFSKSGFDKKLKDVAEVQENIVLIDLDEIFSGF